MFIDNYGRKWKLARNLKVGQRVFFYGLDGEPIVGTVKEKPKKNGKWCFSNKTRYTVLISGVWFLHNEEYDFYSDTKFQVVN